MVRLALPKGRLQNETDLFLEAAAIGITGYADGTRNYRLTSKEIPGLRAKIFQERDIAVQVAIGNYDLGICGFNWIEDLTSKFPASNIVIIKGLGYGKGKLCLAASGNLGVTRAAELRNFNRTIAIASEYPNLAEVYAAKYRLKRFKIFPVWGSAEVYPSFGTDLAIFMSTSPADLDKYDLVPIESISSTEAFLIANRNSWESVDLGRVLDQLCQTSPPLPEQPSPEDRRGDREEARGVNLAFHFPSLASETLRLALPDGHQKKHVEALLNRAGIKIAGYNAPTGRHPLEANLLDVLVKVIRPQDMPAQVANGNLDVAVTGRDWLCDHLCAFPSSPVKELADLKFGRVKLVAVVPNEMKVNKPADLPGIFSKGEPRPLRVASEYVNIADKYCRDKRLGHYKVIPTWGATEAFLPEDADLLIENTETGQTLARHNLKILDVLFESSACLIGSAREPESPAKRTRMDSLVEMLDNAAG